MGKEGMSMYDDWYTNTEADAGRFEDERGWEAPTRRRRISVYDTDDEPDPVLDLMGDDV